MTQVPYNKLFAILCAFVLTSQVKAQSFYDINTIQNISVTFSQSNWDYQLDTAKTGSEGYIMAKSVSVNGMVFDSVGVKYKGNSTYNPNQAKNPLHIELDTYKNQDYHGYTDIKLSNAAKDPSFVREVLSYSLLRQYMDASLSNYANVSINNNLIGLYVSSESVSKKFVNNHFYSNDNAFFKCNPIGGAGPGGSAPKPNLAYLGNDSASYSTAYEINSDYGWVDLISLCNTLKNNITGIETILDVDRALWMIAFDNILVNLDSYIGGFTQNYYLYKDDNGRFDCVLWDFNESFGTFNQTGTIQLPNTTAKSQMTHLLHASDANWPLVQKLLSVPTYKKMYLAHLHTILNENFSTNTYYTAAQALQQIINASVQADPNKFFTYSQYQSNLNNDVTAGNTNAPGITKLMDARYTYLSALPDFTNTKPSISDVAPSAANPEVNTSIFISAKVLNTNTNSVYLGYRNAIADKFTKTLMYDDGAHGDGASGDNVYGASVLMSNTYMQYYIYAENSNVGAFSPVRAEHEFYTINTIITTINPGDLVVNELMAQNTATVTDPGGDYADWIELYNNTANVLSLDNLYMSDTYSNLLKWQFPAGTTVDPKGYLIVWADEDLAQEGLHADFKLSASGENVILSYSDGTKIEEVAFGPQTADMGYARVPNGTGAFMIQNPTFNMNNDSLLGIDEEVANEVSLFKNFPNPFTQQTAIAYHLAEALDVQLKVYDLFGRELTTLVNEYQQAGEYKVSFKMQDDNPPAGIYFCRIIAGGHSEVIKMVCLK
jgi:hypothetical protein